MQVVETIKRFGIKFKRVTRTFESLKPSDSYEDLVRFENEAIFRSVEIPSWCDADKLIKAYSKRSIRNYKNDKDLQTEIQNLKKSKRKGRPLLSFTQFMIARFESKKDRYLEMEAHRFLNSNLPLSFYNKVIVLDNTYYDFLKVLGEIVRIYEFRAETSRSFDMYKKRINGMKSKLGPLLDQIDKCCFASSRLKKCISVWSAKNYKDVFYPEFLDITKMDYPTFEKLSNESNKQLRETRGLMLQYDPNFIHRELELNDPTTRMFGKLVMLPQSSQDLGNLS